MRYAPILLGLTPARVPAIVLAGCAERNTVEPVAQQFGLAERPRPSGQNQEYGLEGILRVMAIAQELAADTQDHRPVTGDKRGERGLAGVVAPRDESLKQLAVAEAHCRAAVEKRPELPDQRWRYHVSHAA